MEDNESGSDEQGSERRQEEEEDEEESDNEVPAKPVASLKERLKHI